MSRKSKYHHWTYPDVPKEINELLFDTNKEVVVVGVIGKSRSKDCNKLKAFGILEVPAIVTKHEVNEGQIDFYYNASESILIVHFETTNDNSVMLKELESSDELFEFFHERCRCRFAQIMLLVLHISHIVVYVETGNNFDPVLLKLFRSLKVIRERYVSKFLPRLLKNTSASTVLKKSTRLCAARLVFLFENYPVSYGRTKEAISKLEFEAEDSIYWLLKQQGIVNRNFSTTLFYIHNNKQFVYYNTNEHLHDDMTDRCARSFQNILKKTEARLQDSENDDLIELLPRKGFARSYAPTDRERELANIENELSQHNFKNFLSQHIQDALKRGNKESTGAESKNKFQFEVLPATVWYEFFTTLHKIFIDNPDNSEYETNDTDYKLFLRNFSKIVNPDITFYKICTERGLRQGFTTYKRLATHLYYSSTSQTQMVAEAVDVFLDHARGPYSKKYEHELREQCRMYWEDGRQQCESLSLRGNPCTLPKSLAHENLQHTSNQMFVSSCNCGRTQGRRDDPYTIRQANYEFYEFMASICNLCVKVKKIIFPIFEPSSSNYRAAAFEAAFPKLKQYTKDVELDTNETSLVPCEEQPPADFYGTSECSQPTMVSFGSQLSVCLRLSELNVLESDDNESGGEGDGGTEVAETHEFLLQIKEKSTLQPASPCESKMTVSEKSKEFGTAEPEIAINRQASTTEYLPGLIHKLSGEGLLPLFPSWSLVCVGTSSIYSHNVGLMEHFQSGFLSGANFLLPWDVHVRLQRVPENGILKVSGKTRRYRKQGDLIVLKIFVGFEYECPRGHRFMMCAPNKILRGGADIARDSSNQVVHNNMPLYHQCPCRSQLSDVAQLMRIHVVTPKAPVNVILNPKVCTGNFVFTLGLSTPPKLSQSAYWVLRLPYVYQGDDIVIRPPAQVSTEQPLMHGYLLAGMFGVAETEDENETFFKKK